MNLKELIGSKEMADLVLQLRKQYHPQLYCYAVGLCKKFRRDLSFADDLLQRFYLKLLKSPVLVIKKFEKLKLPYLFIMIRNDLCNINLQQKAWKRNEQLYCLYKPDVTDKDDAQKAYLAIELDEIMEKYLTKLEYQIMVLYTEGYKMKEIATMVEINASSVGVKIHRAKRKLKRLLQKNNP